MPTIKVCGLRTREHALAAATAGADWIGLVFAPSRRQVTVAQALEIATTVHQHPDSQRVRLVGLFVNEHPTHVNEIADACGVDYIQLSGDETLGQAAAITRPIIKAIRMDGSTNEQHWIDLALRCANDVNQDRGVTFAPCPLLVDAHVPGSYGGTGVRADWTRAANLARQHALMLAGGLKPDNVAEAIAAVQPWGVDVSSGIETDGVKDAAKIEAFIGAVRSIQ